MRLRVLAATACILAVVAAAAPGRASGVRCFVESPVSVSVGFRSSEPAGTGPECSPSLNCFSTGGCSWVVEMTIGGIGVVGAQITGPGMDRVTCGPALRSCTVTTPVFFQPFGGGPPRCVARDTAALRVELLCRPVLIN